MIAPDVSTIIPTFRREKEVVLAVESVLAQADASVECLVFDDSPSGSARAAVEGIGDPRVRYFQRDRPTGGKPAIVRNEAVRHARGRYLHFLDDDDLVAAGAYHDVVRALDAEPDRGVAVGWVVPFGDDPEWLHDKASYFSQAARRGADTPNSLVIAAHILFRGTIMVNSACFIRRELFDTLDGFDPAIPVYEDVDFWMRAIRRHRHVYVQRPVLHYRVGRPSLMNDLGFDSSLVVESNELIQQKYKASHGSLEYWFLRLCARGLPDALLHRIPR